MNVKQLAKKWIAKGKENSPALLTGVVVFGVVMTGVSAYKAGLKARDILERYEEDMRDTDPDDKETKHVVMKETIKEMVPVVLPTVISGGVTIAAAIGSQKISSRRLAVMGAAYNISERSLRDLNTKMRDMLGEKKTREIKDEIVKDKMKKDPKVIHQEEVVITGSGTVLCKDLYSGDFFPSNASKIEEAIRVLSGMVRNEMFVELNEFRHLLGLDQKAYGRGVGFVADDLVGYEEQIPIYISAQLTDDKKPCLCVDYEDYLHPDPKYR